MGYEKGYEAGLKFWSEWEGPNGDGTLGSLSFDFILDGPANAAYDLPPEEQPAYIDGFMDAWFAS